MGRIKAWSGVVLALLLLCGCGSEKAAAFSQTLEQAQETEIEALLRQASELTSMYFYDEALALLENCGIEDERIKAAIVDNRARIATLTEYTGDVAHIFFHSLIVYPEMVFKDTETASGGYNAGFAEKQELEKILPQLYERGYVLYSLDEIWEMTSEGM